VCNISRGMEFWVVSDNLQWPSGRWYWRIYVLSGCCSISKVSLIYESKMESRDLHQVPVSVVSTCCGCTEFEDSVIRFRDGKDDPKFTDDNLEWPYHLPSLLAFTYELLFIFHGNCLFSDVLRYWQEVAIFSDLGLCLFGAPSDIDFLPRYLASENEFVGRLPWGGRWFLVDVFRLFR